MKGFSFLHRRLFFQPLFLVLSALILLPFVVQASETDGTVSSPACYAWGENIGWLHFCTMQGNVHVQDEGLSGYVWGDIIGWMNLRVSSSVMVTNDSEGNLGGYAWSETVGWVDFDGVTIDEDGVFSGNATVLGDGSQISLNCENTGSCTASDFHVATDWRPARVRLDLVTPRSPGGGFSGASDSDLLVTKPDVLPEDDILIDEVVDVIDFNEMMVHWARVECGVLADRNGDCRVDIMDFNLLMVYWGLPFTL